MAGVQTELWVVPGLQDKEKNGEKPELSDALLPLLPVHTLKASQSVCWRI